MNFATLKTIRGMSDSDLVEIALRLAVDDPEHFNRLLNGDKVEYLIYRDSGEYLATARLSAGEVADIRRASDRGKISAIKRAREITGLGLLEAKLLVEANGWY